MIKLYNEHCLKIMAEMPDDSVDLVLTDVPYYSTELHFDKDKKIDFGVWLRQCKRILKPNGILITFADLNIVCELRGHKVFSTFYELIWQKTIAMGFLDANVRPLRGHEYICVMTNQLKKATYNPQKTKGVPYSKQRTASRIAHCGDVMRSNTENHGDRHPTSVIKCGNGNRDSLHPTQKPIDLMKWLVRSYSNEGDLILDPFMGSGSTGEAAVTLGRKFIGCELHKPYFEISEKRILGEKNDNS